MTSAAITGNLCLGHVLAVTGLDLSDIAIIRHTYTDNGLRSPSDLTTPHPPAMRARSPWKLPSSDAQLLVVVFLPADEATADVLQRLGRRPGSALRAV